MKLSDEEVKSICRLGQGPGCCAFLGMAPDGWECLKTNPQFNATIKERLLKNSMNAKGEGEWEGCKYKE